MGCLLNLPALASEPVVVNVDNFVRTETAVNFDKTLALLDGEVNKFVHIREPQPLDKQSVIRMNRDTLYSGAIVDISKGATLTIPETNGRYVSVMVVNEDHYINNVYHDPGTYQLTMEEFDSPYVNITIRTLIDASDPADIEKANAIQDGILTSEVLGRASNANVVYRSFNHLNYSKRQKMKKREIKKFNLEESI